MSDAISWDDLRLVHAIVECGSMVRAAEDLGLNHSTIFRRLNALEKELGVKLFERSRAGYAATAAGREMAALAGRMAQDIAELERSLAGRDDDPSGILRITTHETFLVHFLSPVLASFKAACPRITVDMIASQQALNLSRRDADVAIRAAIEPPETLVGRRICAMPWARYAPACAQQQSSLQTGNASAVLKADDAAPAAAGWIGFGDKLAVIRANRWLAAHTLDKNIVLRCDNLLAVASAIATGIGCSILPCFIGDRTPGIVRFGDPLDFGYSLWLLTHADLRNAVRVRAFMDHAAREMMKCRPLIEGRCEQAVTGVNVPASM